MRVDKLKIQEAEMTPDQEQNYIKELKKQFDIKNAEDANRIFYFRKKINELGFGVSLLTNTDIISEDGIVNINSISQAENDEINKLRKKYSIEAIYFSLEERMKRISEMKKKKQ